MKAFSRSVADGGSGGSAGKRGNSTSTNTTSTRRRVLTTVAIFSLLVIIRHFITADDTARVLLPAGGGGAFGDYEDTINFVNPFDSLESEGKKKAEVPNGIRDRSGKGVGYGDSNRQAANRGPEEAPSGGTEGYKKTILYGPTVPMNPAVIVEPPEVNVCVSTRSTSGAGTEGESPAFRYDKRRLYTRGPILPACPMPLMRVSPFNGDTGGISDRERRIRSFYFREDDESYHPEYFRRRVAPSVRRQGDKSVFAKAIADAAGPAAYSQSVQSPSFELLQCAPYAHRSDGVAGVSSWDSLPTRLAETRVWTKVIDLLLSNGACNEVPNEQALAIQRHTLLGLVNSEHQRELTILEWGSTCRSAVKFFANYFTNSSDRGRNTIQLNVMSLHESAQKLRHARAFRGSDSARDRLLLFSKPPYSSLKFCPDFGGDLRWIPNETFNFVVASEVLQNLVTTTASIGKGNGKGGKRADDSDGGVAGGFFGALFGLGGAEGQDRAQELQAGAAAAGASTNSLDGAFQQKVLCNTLAHLIRVTKVGGAVWAGHMTDHGVVTMLMSCKLSEEALTSGLEEVEDDGSVWGGAGSGSPLTNTSFGEVLALVKKLPSSPAPSTLCKGYTVRMDVIGEHKWLTGRGGSLGVPMDLFKDKPRSIIWRKVPL